MPRSDRSSQGSERTAQDRERARLEREQRRAERAGEPLPKPTPAMAGDAAADQPPLVTDDAVTDQPPIVAYEQPIDESPPPPANVHSPLSAAFPPPAPEQTSRPPAHAPVLPAHAPPSPEEGPPEPTPVPQEMPPLPQELPSLPQELPPRPQELPPEPPPRPQELPPEPPPRPQELPPEPPPRPQELPPEPPPPAAAAATSFTAEQPPEPAVPPSASSVEESHVASAAPPALPPLPPELGGPRKAPPRRSGGRSWLTRVAAVLALLAVVAAVVLVVRSLNRPATHSAAIVALPVVKVLIPEGKTRAQIAEIAAADHLKGSYRDASKRSPLLDPAQYGAPHGTSTLEGFLFPATYDMNPGDPVDRLVQEQLVAFREHFGADDIARAKALHVTPYQLLTIASMVEREAQVPGDRAKIAAVIYNRLREGMPLGIDASIYYAVEQRSGISTYTHELTEAQLHINSPYNTRTHTGLPPTPISNPGEASIEAAAHPAHAAYLYYVAGADGCGEQVFSNTQAEFEANVASYEAAKQKNGGRPPTCKHTLAGTGK